MPACCSWNDVLQYETNKVTRIQSVNYGTIKWVLHVIVFSYVSFALVSDKLYQRKEPVISSVHTKVKGVAEVTENSTEGGEVKSLRSIFDTADYTFPLQGNSFFVMTNFLKSEGQEQKLCPEFPTSPSAKCKSDRDCTKGWMDPQSKGIQTGKCIQYDKNRKTCEIFAWCPAEEGKEAPRPALLGSAENFTVLIKNNIDFPGHNYTTGIMGIEIYWDCNLDSWSHRCRPKYSFRRLDDKYTNKSLIPGYNFRYAKYYKENNVEKRTLIKAFGIRFDILVFGTGGKFDIIQLVVYIGSTLSYFGLATVFIDLLINTYSSAFCRSGVYPCCKCCEFCAVNEYYYRKKYELVMEPKSTLKCVSFVDEPHIRMVDQQLLGKSLQVVKGQEVPRPQADIMDLSRLSLSLHGSSPIPGQPEEMQLLCKEVAPGSKDSPGWCQCGNCLPSRLPENRRALEELCCRRKPGPCITTSELFRKLVLSRQALQLLLLYQEPLLVLEEEAANRRLRHCAYRCYAIWRFGSQDMADFAILPSCCRWRIRKEFPKSEGQYSGFKYPY
ncbi:P2X purinoceptor 7 [Lemmus lemmus]